MTIPTKVIDGRARMCKTRAGPAVDESNLQLKYLIKLLYTKWEPLCFKLSYTTKCDDSSLHHDSFRGDTIDDE